jgi:hypothetical protein
MPTPINTNNTPGSTADSTYTGIRFGNDHGSISFGHIHKDGAVTADVLLQATDGRHSIVLDKNGQRKGTTTSTSPGRFQIKCGMDSAQAEDTLLINAVNGNIIIKADKGNIRLEGVNIDLVAVGEGGDKGNIRITSSESTIVKGKKVSIEGTAHYKLATTGTAEIVANSSMKIYSSIIRGVTDAVKTRDSKVGGQDFCNENNQVED